MILQNENGEDLDLLKVSRVIVIDSVQYACILDEVGTTYCRVIKEFDNTTHIQDIEDDEDFLKVQEVFNSLGEGN